MRICKIIILLLSLVDICFAQEQDSTVLDSPDYAGEVKATVQVDNKEVPQNRTVTYTIKISWNGDLDRFEITNVENPVLTNMEIVGNSSSNWVGELNGIKQAIKNYEFILKPQALGMAYIDGVIIEYKDLETDKTQRLVTNRLEIKVIDPIVEGDISGWILTGSVILGLGAFAGVGILFLKRKRAKEADRKARELESVPIEENYLSDLKGTVDLSNSNMVASFSSLSKIFRTYLSEKYQISALEITTQEIANELNKLAVDEKTRSRAQEVLNACDVAKFSGGQVDRGTLERAYTLVEEILNQNKSDYLNSSNKVAEGSSNKSQLIKRGE